MAVFQLRGSQKKWWRNFLNNTSKVWRWNGKMITFPNAKVNLGLNIVAKRPDGYHEINSCIYPIPWCDVLEIIPAKKFSFQQTGLKIDGEPMNNLCVKAYESLSKDFDLAPVSIHLHKVIPMGAGLGGGSADCSFCLKSLNQIFDLGLSITELETYASALGSDCPFFIKNVPALATGTGTTLKTIDLQINAKYIGVIYPNIHVSTQQAYAGTTPKAPIHSLESILEDGSASWQKLLFNDFEQSVFQEFPEIEHIKNKMTGRGAIYASMTGSGSAVFGLFESRPDEKGFDFFEEIKLNAIAQDF